MEDYTKFCYQQSELLTKQYSTSFYLATKLLDKNIRKHIYAIYGMVRVADELVDSFKPKNTEEMLNEFEAQVYLAMKTNLSLNPVLHAFANTCSTYSIDKKLIRAFFMSMCMDITKKTYSKKEYEDYIYGSAEVIGLMCLMVFVGGDKKLYKKLKPSAQVLGSAFQKVNFLRDINIDNSELGRMYFPDIKLANLTNYQKKSIEREIAIEFKNAQKAIAQLPYSSKYGVLLALWYYQNLLAKISRTDVTILKKNRIRISNYKKLILLTAVLSRKLLHI